MGGSHDPAQPSDEPSPTGTMPPPRHRCHPYTHRQLRQAVVGQDQPLERWDGGCSWGITNVYARSVSGDGCGEGPTPPACSTPPHPAHLPSRDRS